MKVARVIPCLDVTAGRVVKGVNFVGLRDAGDPVELAERYDREGADELVFLDITASSDGRDIMEDVVRRVADEVFIPFTVGIIVTIAKAPQSLLVLPFPALQGQVIDRLTRAAGGASAAGPYAATELLVASLVIPLACLLARWALGLLSGSLMNQASLGFVRRLTDDLHRKLQRLPLSYFDRSETGQLMARLTNDVGTLLIFLNASSLQLVADLILAAGIVVALFVCCWPLALASLAVGPLFYLHRRCVAATLLGRSVALQEQTAGLYAYLSERLTAVRTIRALGAAGWEEHRFRDRLWQHASAGERVLRALLWQNTTASLLCMLATAAMTGLAAMAVGRAWISGHTTLMLDPDDPWPAGYKVSDTWPNA